MSGEYHMSTVEGDLVIEDGGGIHLEGASRSCGLIKMTILERIIFPLKEMCLSMTSADDRDGPRCDIIHY